MNTELTPERTSHRVFALPAPRPMPDPAVMPPRAALEIKRSILKKLSLRLPKDCFCS
jgi:hypothetical protein